MTRDEAIDVLKNSIWYYPPDVTSDEYDDRTDVYIAAEMAIEALKQQPQPDPETGLMPCGCGGKAKEAKEETSIDEIGGDYISRVFCEECGIATEYYSDGNVAFLDWNRAMGCVKEGEV